MSNFPRCTTRSIRPCRSQVSSRAARRLPHHTGGHGAGLPLRSWPSWSSRAPPPPSRFVEPPRRPPHLKSPAPPCIRSVRLGAPQGRSRFLPKVRPARSMSTPSTCPNPRRKPSTRCGSWTPQRTRCCPWACSLRQAMVSTGSPPTSCRGTLPSTSACKQTTEILRTRRRACSEQTCDSKFGALSTDEPTSF